jgi:hypothetical protein
LQRKLLDRYQREVFWVGGKALKVSLGFRRHALIIKKLVSAIFSEIRGK